MGIGKDYKKGDPVRGGAILILSMERLGQTPKGSDDVIKATLADLGVKEKDARRYLQKHRSELIELLKQRGIG